MERLAKNKDYVRQLGQLAQWIKEIGNKHGAKKHFFRHEGAADALPPPKFQYIAPIGKNKYGLRLYCIRLNDFAVILLNGDLKTHDKANECINCKKHFNLANKVSKRIDKALSDKEIFFDKSEIYFDDDFELNI